MDNFDHHQPKDEHSKIQNFIKCLVGSTAYKELELCIKVEAREYLFYIIQLKYYSLFYEIIKKKQCSGSDR